MIFHLVQRLRHATRSARLLSPSVRHPSIDRVSYVVETLESRVLLANVVVTGTGGDDLFAVSVSGAELVVTRNSVEVARQALANIDSFEIWGGDGDDTVNLAASIVSNSGIIHLDVENIVLQNNVTLATAGAAGNNVTIAGAINADSPASNRTLAISAGAGAVALRDDVGESNAIAALSVTASGLIELSGDVTTTNDQTYSGAVRIAGVSELSAANVTFTSRVDSVSDGSGQLTINLNGSGNSGGLILFQGRVGDAVRLGSLTTGPLGLTRFTPPDAPTTQNDYAVETTQFQLFGNAVELGQSTFFGATGSSGNRTITFSSTLRSTGNGNAALGVGTNDVITFNGAIGDNNQRIFSLTTSNAAATAIVGTTTRIQGSSVTTVTTQRYFGHVILDSVSDSTVLTTGNNSSSQGLFIAGNLNSAVAGQDSLTVSTSGNVELNGGIGNNQRLDSLTFASVTPAGNTGPGNITLGSSLAIDGDFLQEAGTGITTFRTTSIGGMLDVTTNSVVISSGAFNFSGIAAIDADVTLSGSSSAQFDINGATPGLQFDRLEIEGAINLSNVALAVVTPTSFNLGSGAQFLIVENDGADSISGTFAGLAEGALVSASGRFYKISYVAGDGNDIALTDVTSEVSISANQVALNEQNSGTTDFVFTLTRTGDINTASTVNYSVTSTDAEADDFLGGAFPSGSVTFAVGETSKTLTIAIAGDQTLESDESFSVTISQPSAGTILGTATASSTIVNDDYSFVDVNNDGIFNGSDILLDDEIADGVFNTRKAEGDYTAVVRGAGLVISTPLVAETIDLRAEGNVIINADTTAQADIKVLSTTGDVTLAGINVSSATGGIRVVAKQDLVVNSGQISTVGTIRLRGATGGMEVVDARLVGDRMILSGNGLIDLDNNDIVASNGPIKILGEGPLEINDSTLTATTDILVRSNGIVAETSNFTALGSILLKSRNDVLSVQDSQLRSQKAVTLLASASIAAENAVIQAASLTGRVTVTSRDADIDLENATVRSGKQISLRGKGEVGLEDATVGNIVGSTRGVVSASGNELQLDNARIVASYRVILRGDQLGAALEINDAGTLPLV